MAAPKTVLTYPLNGSNKDFTIPFEYLARKFVTVTLIGATRQVLTLNSDYRFTTRTTINTTKAWGPADVFESIELRRVTSATERLVDFSDGSILRAFDLNTSQVQSLHIAEEARDLTADTIGVNNDGDLDARGRRIVNVADSVNDWDAVNLRQQKVWAGSALNQANRAQAEANRSQAEADRAAINNQQSYTNNVQSAGNAQVAIRERQAAEAAAIASAQSNNNASLWADDSRKWSVSSQDHANASADSASVSKDSAAQAFQDANRSRSEADRAKTEADKLGNSNKFMATLRDIIGSWVIWNGPWGLNAEKIATDTIVSRSGSRVVIDTPETVVQGHLQINSNTDTTGTIISGGNIFSRGNIDSARGTYDSGQRVWSPLNFDPTSKQNAHDGTQGAPCVYSNINPWQQDPSVQEYVASIELREAVKGSIGAGGHDLFSPSILFHWGGYTLAKLRMNTSRVLEYGTQSGGFSEVAFRGSKFLTLWSGRLFSAGESANLGRSILGKTLFVRWTVGSAPEYWQPVAIPAMDNAMITIGLTNTWATFQVTNAGQTITLKAGDLRTTNGLNGFGIDAPYHVT